MIAPNEIIVLRFVPYLTKNFQILPMEALNTSTKTYISVTEKSQTESSLQGLSGIIETSYLKKKEK